MADRERGQQAEFGMRVSRERAAESRQRILDAASEMFRQRGFDGVGLTELMRAAGMTHGGFYGHFASKDDLAAEACRRALGDTVRQWQALAAARKASGEEEETGDAVLLDRIVASYLSPRHRDDVAGGCPLAALGGEVKRREPIVARSFTEGLCTLIDILDDAMPVRDAAERRAAVLALLSGMVGALLLARAVDDPALSAEILAAATARFGSHAGRPDENPLTD